MAAAQKEAWFNLVIVLVVSIGVLALVPVLGPWRAQGWFGVLGLLGFGPFFFRKRAGIVVSDERDDQIRRRSTVIAHVIFWLFFVAACVAASVTFGPNGAVPVAWVQMSGWWGWVLVVGVGSVATLTQYGWGRSHEA